MIETVIHGELTGQRGYGVVCVCVRVCVFVWWWWWGGDVRHTRARHIIHTSVGAVHWVVDVLAVSPPSALTGDVKAFSAGSKHSMVLKEDDSLWATGEGHSGQLGDGSNSDKKKYVLITCT